MSLAVWFWVIYVFSILFGVYVEWYPGAGQPAGVPYLRIARTIIFYILIGILGIHDFGGPIKG